MKYIMFKREMTSVAHYVPILSSVEIPASVYGGSETLGVQHDPKDTHRINMSDYGGCFE